MKRTLNLPPEMEFYFIRKAKEKGILVEDYILVILADYILKDINL
ncbi:MAG: hypothetical protein AAF915_03660 [Cyanobacteria bacterium P01_D01_bin.50]